VSRGWSHRPPLTLGRSGVDARFTELPSTALKASLPKLRERVVGLVSTVAGWPYVKVPVATKLPQIKRLALISVLDDRAIFGALLWQAWEPPERESRADLVVGRDVVRIAATLDAIHQDLVCPENEPVSESLAPLASERHGKKPTRIELFDMVWWRYFGDREPAPGRRAAVGASGT